MSSNNNYILQSFFADLEALAVKYKVHVAQLGAPAQTAAAPAEEIVVPPAQVAPPAEEWTHEKVMTGAKKIVDKHGGNTNPLIEALHRLGFQKVSQVPVEKLGELVSEIKRAYGEK